MGKPLFRRRIRFATTAMPVAIAASAFATMWLTPVERSDIDPVFSCLAAGIVALVLWLVLRHRDDFAPYACGRCGRFLRTLEVPFTAIEGVERLKQAVEAGEVAELESVARMPLPSERGTRWVGLRVQACPHCADRVRVTLVDLRTDRTLAGPSGVAASPAALVEAGTRRQDAARAFVGVRLLS